MINEKINVMEFKDIQDKLGLIGTTIISNDKIVETIPNATTVSVSSVDLDPGKYIIFIGIRFKKINAGQINFGISATKDASNNVFSYNIENQDRYRIIVPTFRGVEEKRTYYLNISHVTGADVINDGCTITAIRIA